MAKQRRRLYTMQLDRQEAFLNEMAKKGWRLQACTRFAYAFVPCEPGAFAYRVAYTGPMSEQKHRDFRAFVQGLNYDVFARSMGMPGVGAAGGDFGREVLVIGKRADGADFAIGSTNANLAEYYTSLRNLHIAMFVLYAVALGLVWWLAKLPWFVGVALGVVGLLLLLPAVQSGKRAKRYRARVRRAL